MQLVTTAIPAVRVYPGKGRFHHTGRWYYRPANDVGSYPFSEPYDTLRDAFEAGLRFRLGFMREEGENP